MPIEAPEDIKRIIKDRSDLFERNFAAATPRRWSGTITSRMI